MVVLDFRWNLRKKLVQFDAEQAKLLLISDEANRAVDLQLVGFETDEFLLKFGVSDERPSLHSEVRAGRHRDSGRNDFNRRGFHWCRSRFDDSLDNWSSDRCGRRLSRCFFDLLRATGFWLVCAFGRSFDDGGRGGVGRAGGWAVAAWGSESSVLHSFGEAVDGLNEGEEQFIRDVDFEFHG